MIVELSIRNFAIIDDISITFNDGLTVLTGETGAGKSIIIDAVELLAGGRASVDFVRYGEAKAEIVGLFSIEDEDHPALNKFTTYGIDIEDNMITLERTITSKGKSICRVNGKIVTLTILKEIGQTIINIHSQHDTIHLMDANTHIQLLDMYHFDKLAPTKTKYDVLFNELSVLRQKYEALNDGEQQIAHRIDLLQFQLKEIDAANLVENEDVTLTEERNQLHNYEKIHQATHDAYNAVYGDGKALELVHIAQTALQNGSKYDPFIAEKLVEITNLYFTMEELSFELRNYTDGLQFDEGKLNMMEGRLNEINRLSKKYGDSVADILKYRKKIFAELDEIQHKDSRLEMLEKEMNEVRNKALKVAQKMHEIRKTTAKKLKTDIKIELANLYLENADFDVQFTENTVLNSNGIDNISFLLSTNLGEPLKEIRKVASGGELSRIMLALKNIFAKHDKIGTVIFDEIDTGVSGRVAEAIGEKMYEISQSTQVLCITHLPQVAAMSDQHLLISKREKSDRTTTLITDLTTKDKTAELAGMMTGTEITKSALEHAEQLLELSTQFKEKYK